MIKLILRSEIVKTVPDRWADQYEFERIGSDKIEIKRRLFDLKVNGLLTRQLVDETIGNGSWTDNNCDECDSDCDVLVRLGQDPDYESRWVDLCQSCLKEALTIMEPSND